MNKSTYYLCIRKTQVTDLSKMIESMSKFFCSYIKHDSTLFTKKLNTYYIYLNEQGYLYVSGELPKGYVINQGFFKFLNEQEQSPKVKIKNCLDISDIKNKRALFNFIGQNAKINKIYLDKAYLNCGARYISMDLYISSKENTISIALQSKESVENNRNIEKIYLTKNIIDFVNSVRITASILNGSY